jgi:hypothetical protein
MMLGPRLVGDRDRDALDERAIPSSTQPDDLRKDGGPAIPAHTVASLAPPIIGWHSEPLDRGVVVHELPDFLRQSESRNEIVDARTQGQIRIKKRKFHLRDKENKSAASRVAREIDAIERLFFAWEKLVEHSK